MNSDHLKIRPYGDPNNHVRLADLLPLMTPLSLMIDPSNICNFRCHFCPTGHPELTGSIKRPKGVMEYALYCKIVNDIKNFPGKLKRLHLYKDGEPFLNRDLGKMIAYAIKSDIADSVETTTNGSLLTSERAKEIIDAGLDRIRISVEHIHDKGYQAITQTFSNYATILKNVEILCREKERQKSRLQIHAKLVDTGLSSVEKEQFFRDFGGITDNMHIDEIMGWSDSEKFDFTLGRDLQVGMDCRIPMNRRRTICPLPFYTLAINFNGEVSVCCVDWTMKTTVGDCRKEELIKIWGGERLMSFRLLHLKGQRGESSACRNCQYIYGLSHASDLDKYADHFLKEYDDT